MNIKSPMAYTVSVNNVKIELTPEELENLDLIENGSNAFHLISENQSYSIHVEHADFLEKKLTLLVNANKYEIGIADSMDQMVKEMGMLNVVAEKVNEIYAPMPGLIIDILIEEGQEVEKGTPLVVLSAMKMENVILSEGEGIVKFVKVKKDAAVDKGQIIIEME
ncbi:biotin/lipoyl-containing protein [Aurantibacter sp.]|uniref:biotin/lipoyl-containing protein n=1 Tax=Aurantibacter sp. TaxID=2807103 RepID=UPI003263845F